ncbi:MAG: Hsp20/alpha crystallin family protein [Methanobacterium sp. ERen5]|nr:MAG: Hsp20/alpha crystallin family protein [Methanobacterium sp. ERen5]
MPVVESNEEMKKNMEKIKRKNAKSHENKVEVSHKSETNEDTKSIHVEKTDPKKKGEVNVKMEKMGENTPKTKVHHDKDHPSPEVETSKIETGDNKIKVDKTGETKGKTGRTPAEKILNDIVTRFKQGSDQINEVISDTTDEAEAEASKKPLVKKPLVDVLETNDTIYLIADITGIKKDEIELGISKNNVEITAVFKDGPEIEGAKFAQKERNYGKTHRKIMLSTDVKINEAKAKFKDCTLTITLPKKVEDLTKIEIEG